MNWTRSDTSGITMLSLAIKGTTLFAGSIFDGIHISRDNGESWTKSDSGLPFDAVVHSVIIIDSTVFAGTNHGVFVSSDNGTSWNSASTGLEYSTVVTSLLSDGTTLFAGTDGNSVWKRPLSEFEGIGIDELKRDNSLS